MLMSIRQGDGMNAKVIAIMQEKGGAQKTTTAINLTGALQSLGYKVRLYDMDPKPDALKWASHGEELKAHVVKFTEDNPKIEIEKIKEDFDFIILDSPPNLMNEAFKAAICCDFAIIPCSSSLLDQNSLIKASMLASMASKPYYFLASRVSKNTTSARSLMKQLEEVGSYFETQITTSVDVENSIRTGQWVGSYKPNCKSHKQYVKLAKEVIHAIGEKK